MKYCLRTVSWKFHETTETIPELSHQTKVIAHSPEDVFKHYISLFKGQVRERFVVFWLDASNKVMGFEVITEGILTASLVHPREVFRGAILVTCAAIIIAHNHPSGNSDPSAEDVSITRQLVETGKVVGIAVHDHVIFTDTGYTSFAEKGLL